MRTQGGALASWFAVSAIASGGLMGLFFLAFLTRRAHRVGVYCGIAVNLSFSAWAAVMLVSTWAPRTDGGRS